MSQGLLSYVWDFGYLDSRAERAYVLAMIEAAAGNWPPGHTISRELLCDILLTSQEFIRHHDSPHAVSLRDVLRCIRLITFFLDFFQKRLHSGGMHRSNSSQPQCQAREVADSKDYISSLCAQRCCCSPTRRAVVLALALTYHARLVGENTDLLRENYRQNICEHFIQHGTSLSGRTFLDVLHDEQEDMLCRMNSDVFKGMIAHNGALLENVFVMVICILNQLPVFIVGKPGNSKSLAMQLVNNSLRGQDSQDPLFKEYPGINVVAYQGSEDSTSDGIIKVFKKAEHYAEQSRKTKTNAISCVLLDEVGLAGNAPSNPLKVLHNLLEPDGSVLKDLAVVGISNWALDAAKMNRAVFVHRPDPNEEDLRTTGIAILKALNKDAQSLVRRVAGAYFAYYPQQKFANFHGLRDFYAVLKYIGSRSGQGGATDSELLRAALERNFGGALRQRAAISDAFGEKLDDNVDVVKLIRENLDDRAARHLLIFTKGSSAHEILTRHIGERIRTIHGSRFLDDRTGAYSYRILSQIILSMEMGQCLVLRDLQSIYGALYDMLNQNYTLVGGRRHCRIALGAESNPLCHVHENFRCIVIEEESESHSMQPPF